MPEDPASSDSPTPTPGGGAGGDADGDSSGGSSPGRERERAEERSDSSDGDSEESTPSGGSSPGRERQDEQGPPATEVGNDGPNGRVPTDRELFGGRDEPPAAPGEFSDGDDPMSGVEDENREQYHTGLEDEDEEDLSGLESQNGLDENVKDGVSELEQRIQEQRPGLDEDDYAIRREGDRLTVEYDEAAVAGQIASNVLEENPGLDRGDFEVRRGEDGSFRVDYGERHG